MTTNNRRTRAVTSRDWLNLAVLAEAAARNPGLTEAARAYYVNLAIKCDEHTVAEPSRDN